MSLTVNLLLSGISQGMLIFLIAAGLTLIFGLMGVLNFAHGAIFIWGAYVGWSVYGKTGSFLLAIVAGTVAGFVLGYVIERYFVRPFYSNHVAQILLTLGLMIVLTELISVIWGPNQLGFDKPPLLKGVVNILNQPFPIYDFFNIGIGLIVLLALQFMLKKTKYGMIIRAGVEDPEMVQSLGINVKLTFSLVFAFGAALAAFGAVISGPMFGSITPELGMTNQLNAFIVIVIGGIGNFMGAALGSLLVGLLQAFLGYYLPQVAVAVNVLLMVMVLIIKPQGIFGARR